MTYAVEAQSGSVIHVTGQIVVVLGQVGGYKPPPSRQVRNA